MARKGHRLWNGPAARVRAAGPAADGCCSQVARLVALSHGQTQLGEQHWQHMRGLEHQRIQRERLVRRVGIPQPVLFCPRPAQQ